MAYQTGTPVTRPAKGDRAEHGRTGTDSGSGQGLQEPGP